jgi:predicted Holliday junction resolvase-like endonuclease
MIYILIFIIILLLFFVIYLFVNNASIKAKHQINMQKLEQIIASLHSKQQLLNNQVLISDDYKSNYSKDIKAIVEEVVVLQKVFIDIISNKNYK